MDSELLERLKQWNIASALPPSVGDFILQAEKHVVMYGAAEKGLTLFTYANGSNHWSVWGFFDYDTEEFSVRVNIGMLEFSLIEFITGDLEQFELLVKERLPNLVESHYVDRSKDFSVILKDKGVPEMEWQPLLAPEYKGFRCQITPSTAVRIINGSYMIVSYYKEDVQSGLSIMYNLLRDDFFAERRIHNFPNLVHDFDSHTVKELTDALKSRLTAVLDELAADSQ